MQELYWKHKASKYRQEQNIRNSPQNETNPAKNKGKTQVLMRIYVKTERQKP